MAPGVGVLDRGIELDSVVEVERQLATPRRPAAHDGAGPAPSARAAVLNVIVCARRRVHADRAATAIARLAEHHPSRAIVLLRDEDASERVLLSCYQQDGTPNAGVRYQQVLVRTASEDAERLASVVIPLLIPDLPVFLWWTETPPLDAPLFTGLASVAHRVLIDSADFARAEVTLPRLSDLVDGGAAYGITDLSWTRLTPWRELIAQFFDVPEWRPYLDAVTGVRVGFAVDMDGREIHPSQGLLLIGWLAARLGWRAAQRMSPSEAGGLLFRMARADGTPAWIRLRPRFWRGVEDGDVTGVRVLADRDGHHAEFVIKRDEDGSPHAGTRVIVDGETVQQRRVLLPVQGVAELLAEELSITRNDRVYEAALGSLCALTEALG